MGRHLITKKTTNQIKAIAILVVVLGHYARFKQNPLHIASHAPYFGAALFAFMSGYGVFVSYKDHGLKKMGGYIIAKIKRVLFPFILINFVALPLYGLSIDSNYLDRILLGTDDSIMWYPVFIFGFYVIFASVYCTKLSETSKMILTFIFLAVTYLIMVLSNLASQWYTSIFPLLMGLLIGIYEEHFQRLSERKYVLLIVILFVSLIGSSIITRKTYDVVKYIVTGVSGASFALIVFFVSKAIETVFKNKGFRIIEVIGIYSYWGYLVHMKVFTVIERMLGTDGLLSFFLFVLITSAITALFGMMWEKMSFLKNNSRGRLHKS